VGSYHPDSEDEGPPAGEDESAERPYGARPYGTRPYGARPYGARPYGARPYGARPYGARPYGARPYGARPYGARSYGGRPYGARPYGARPYGARPYGARPYPTDVFDPDEWSVDIAELVCERSAVIRLGGRLLTADHELPVATFDAAAAFRAPGAGAPAPGIAGVAPVPLHPGDWQLDAGVVVPPELRRSSLTDPELADTLKLDLAEAVALGADQTFLQGVGPVGPQGIATRVGQRPPAGDLLATARALVAALRPAAAAPHFRNPGWIMAPGTLDALTTLRTRTGLDASGAASARSLDSYRLLQLDGVDGGMFLGFPFVTSAGAGPNLYFAADWEEAWIGVDPSFVSVYVSNEPPPDPPGRGVVIRATMPLDFALRRDNLFVWS
jgi:HK97 family phage major capsid protein